MDLLYQRMSHQGEIHLTHSREDIHALCQVVRVDSPMYYYIDPVPERYPQLCVDCAAKKKELEEAAKPKEEPKVEKKEAKETKE